MTVSRDICVMSQNQSLWRSSRDDKQIRGGSRIRFPEFVPGFSRFRTGYQATTNASGSYFVPGLVWNASKCGRTNVRCETPPLKTSDWHDRSDCMVGTISPILRNGREGICHSIT